MIATSSGEKVTVTVTSSTSAYWPRRLRGMALVFETFPRRRAWLGVRHYRIRLPFRLAKRLNGGIA